MLSKIVHCRPTGLAAGDQTGLPRPGSSAGQLRRVLVIETATPLIAATVVSAAIGFAVIADLAHASHVPWRPPPGSYWSTLAIGTATALAVALFTTIPLLGKLTAPDTARFE